MSSGKEGGSSSASSGQTPADATPAQEPLLFVNVTDASEESRRSNRKKARSYIMSQYHRKTRDKKRKDVSPPKDGSGDLSPGESSKVLAAALASASSTNSSAHLQPLKIPLQKNFYLFGWNNAIFTPDLFRVPSMGNFDLVQFPFELNVRDQRLLHHYADVINRSNIPMNPKQDWLNVVTSDPAMLHVTLILAALHHSLLLKKERNVDALRHQLSITQLLNARFNDAVPSQTDSTILSIACLALMDVLNNAPMSSTPHIKVLVHLVESRGGLDSLGFGGLVRRKVRWADLSSSMAQGTAPRFAYVPVELPASIRTTDMSKTPLCTEAARMASELELEQGLGQVLDEVQVLSLAIGQSNRNEVTDSDTFCFSDFFYQIERQAYSSYLQSGLLTRPAGPGQLGALYLAICVSTIMYSNFALRELPLQAEFFTPFASTYIQLAESIDLESEYPATTFWVLAVGGMISYERVEKKQYVALLSTFCRSRGIKNWEDITREFLGNMYVTPLYVAELRDLWNDVEEEWILESLS